MNFTCNIEFNEPIDKVISLYKNERFPLEKYSLLGHRDVMEVARIEKDNTLETTFKFLMAINPDIPSIAKPFVKGHELLVTTQNEHWNFEERHGTMNVIFEAFKAITTIRCSMQLEPRGEGCVNKMNWDVECSLALIGNRIAKYISDDVKATAIAEGEATKKLLLTR